MNLFKSFFIAIFLLSQINALQAMNREQQMIQVPTRKQIQQIHDAHSFYNKLAGMPVLAVASYWLYRNNFKCVKPEECRYDYQALCASFATIPVVLGCAIRKKFLDYQYEECAFKPLLRAIQADNESAVSEIISADNVNMRSPLSGITPLRLATLAQNGKIVTFILAQNARREDEAVFDAIKTGNADILTLLLKAGCRYNAKQIIQPFGHIFALNYAIRNQKRACVKVLLDAGAHRCRSFTDMCSDEWPGHNAYELAKIHNMSDLVGIQPN